VDETTPFDPYRARLAGKARHAAEVAAEMKLWHQVFHAALSGFLVSPEKTPELCALLSWASQQVLQYDNISKTSQKVEAPPVFLDTFAMEIKRLGQKYTEDSRR
jgi:hypothetical protein